MAVSDPLIVRRLPGNIEAERAVLGAILLDNSAYNQAAALLTADDFQLDSHRRIFARMSEMADASRPIDLVTLAEELSRHNELEAVGGAVYISSLTDGIPRLANIEHYAVTVRDKSMLRRLVSICENVATQALEGTEDADTILDAAESLVLGLGERRVRRDFIHFRDIFRQSFESIDALHDRGKRVTGLETGFPRLDEMTRGLQPGDLIIIAARPSMGKTSLALDIARWAAVREKQPVGIFSLEMSREALTLRLLCAEGDVNAHLLQGGFLGRDDWARMAQALGRLAEAPLYIDDTPALSITQMRAKARRLQKEHGLGLLIVDYLQLMSGGGASVAARFGEGGVAISARFENRTQEVSAISRGLKGLAKELRVPLIAVAQLNRAPEQRDGPPRLSDLRESGQIEQDADLVAFLYRRPQGKSSSDDPAARAREHVRELIIAKQRNGPTGVVPLVFLSQYASFRNPPDDFQMEDYSGDYA